ncbi:MAG: AAA family ATPase [Deltaproteobacteria bacterium]|nr:AAA family ATPase [Deltaproteobacteria bacterium]
MANLFDRSFVFVVGKGGVGKTTVSTALALSAARRGKRVLVAMCNAKERLSHLLEVEPIGPHNREVAPGVDAVNMVPKYALEEYGLMVLKVRAVYKAIFENRFVAAFLRGTPGLEAWSMLGKAYYHTKEEDEFGAKRYDLVILDAPATGHGLEMLRVPQVITDIAPPGLLRNEAEQALELFRDPARGGVVLVTLPEDMPVNETLELHHALDTELAMPVTQLVINGVYPTLFDQMQCEACLSVADALPRGSPLTSLVAASRARALRERLQADAIRRLAAELPVPTTTLPHLFMPDFRRSAVESLSHLFG